jgi:hypothetical protein
MFKNLWNGLVSTCAMLLAVILGWILFTVATVGLVITAPLWVVVFAHMSAKTRNAKDFFAQTIKNIEDLDWDRIFDYDA